MDVDRFSKLMNLTFSCNDHEALAALRKANQVLKDNKLLWSDFLKILIDAAKLDQPTKKPKEADPEPEDTLEADFEEVIPYLKGKTLDFVLDLQTWYEEHGYLSEKQTTAFYSVYERYC